MYRFIGLSWVATCYKLNFHRHFRFPPLLPDARPFLLHHLPFPATAILPNSHLYEDIKGDSMGIECVIVSNESLRMNE